MTGGRLSFFHRHDELSHCAAGGYNGRPLALFLPTARERELGQLVLADLLRIQHDHRHGVTARRVAVRAPPSTAARSPSDRHQGRPRRRSRRRPRPEHAVEEQEQLVDPGCPCSTSCLGCGELRPRWLLAIAHDRRLGDLTLERGLAIVTNAGVSSSPHGAVLVRRTRGTTRRSRSAPTSAVSSPRWS